MEVPEKKNVYKVYDKIAGWFAENRYSGLMERDYLDTMIAALPADASILDVGCGTGTPILNYLIHKGLNVTGLDASTEMLAIAKRDFPSTKFVLQDMRDMQLDEKFDAVIAWHSFFHLPAEDQPAMFEKFRKHLNSGGFLLFTSGTEYGEAWGINGGENLFHSSLDTSTYRQLLEKNGFEVLNYVCQDETCGGATVWFARLVL